ncbi:MAG: metal ABC transporter permease [Actinomycetota bacterium]|nr:metal ABC transporter permease [Actinomycetota bacterium]
MSLYELVVEPVTQYAFMRNGVIAAALVGLAAALLSCLLVVRRQALMGDAISHAVLLGVVVGYLIGERTGIFFGALAVAVAAGLAITAIERHSELELDAAMGVVFTAAFALGLAILSVARPRGVDLNHILFGNILGVDVGDLQRTSLAALVVSLVLVGGWRWFHLWSFDPTMAAAVGLPVAAIHYVFTVLLSVAIVAALQAVGVILVIALLVTPGATAKLLSTRLSTMMAVAAVIGVVGSIGGLYLSFHVDVSSGPAIVLSISLLFVVVLLAAPRDGIIPSAVRRRRAIRRALGEDVLRVLLEAEEGGDDRSSLLELLPVDGRAVERAARRLEAAGLVAMPDGASSRPTLTEQGRAAALRSLRAQRLAEQYAHEAEHLPLSEITEVADRRAHGLGDADLDDLDRVLGSPSADPHGHPIPSATGRLDAIAGRPLAQLGAGDDGTVIMVAADRPDLLREMAAVGILPRTRVEVVGTGDGAIRVRVAEREVEVSTELAQRVYLTTPSTLATT